MHIDGEFGEGMDAAVIRAGNDVRLPEGCQISTSEFRRLYNRLEAGDSLSITSLSSLGSTFSKITDKWRKLMQKEIHVQITDFPMNSTSEADFLEFMDYICEMEYLLKKQRTQTDVGIYLDRLEVVSPGSWLLPKPYEQYPVGSIPSVRRNQMIAACLDVTNLMERGGTGFQTIADAYRNVPVEKQPVVSSYPGFLKLILFDLQFAEEHEEPSDRTEMPGGTSSPAEDREAVMRLLATGPRTAKELQSMSSNKSRSGFLRSVLNSLTKENRIRRSRSRGPKTTYELTDIDVPEV